MTCNTVRVSQIWNTPRVSRLFLISAVSRLRRGLNVSEDESWSGDGRRAPSHGCLQIRTSHVIECRGLIGVDESIRLPHDTTLPNGMIDMCAFDGDDLQVNAQVPCCGP